MVFCKNRSKKLIFDFNTSPERPLSKLSENQKIGPTELKLWLFKDALFNAAMYMYMYKAVHAVTNTHSPG